jgi:uncharacterized protein (DUF2141 family)
MRFATRLLCLLSLIFAVAACGSSSTPPPPPTTFTVSGTVTGAASVSVALTGAATASTTTDGSGNYSFAGLANGSYTVTPTKAGYTFTPASRSVTVASGNQAAQNFTAAQATYTVTGSITGATSVLVNLTQGASGSGTTTDGSGNFSFTVPNGTYTLEPVLAGYTFAPLSRIVVVNGANVAGNSFVATAVTGTTWSIGVQLSGAVLQGVTLTLTQGVTTLGTAASDASGSHIFSGLANGTYVVTPTLAGYSFSPASRTVVVSGADPASQAFVATAIAYTVSGHVSGASGVTVTVTAAAAPPPATTDGSGNYSFSLPNGSYTITPSKTGYAFTPASRVVTVAGANATVPDFAAAVSSTFTLSGTVTGPWVRGVTIALSGASTATTTTDANGAYLISGLPNDTVTVRASLDGYTFSPATPSVTMAGANQVQNFAATPAIASYSISGTVSYAGAKTGRVFVSVYSTGCSTNCTPQARTSIAGPGAYTIRGLQNGGYAVSARRDSVGQGVANASDPTGMTPSMVTISGASVPGADVTLTDPVTPTPGAISAPTVIAGRGGVLVFWNTDKDLSGREKATTYDVSFGTTGAASDTVVTPVARDDGVYFRSGLLTGTTYFFKVRSNVGDTHGAYSVASAGVVGPAAGGFTVSGTVAFTGAATGPLFIAVGDPQSGSMNVSAYPLPLTSPVAFSVSGVPAGTWSVYAILDQNGNGVIDPGDLSNTGGGDAPMVGVSADTPGVSVVLSSAKGIASTSTEHVKNEAGATSGYSLQSNVKGNLQRGR